MLVNVGITRPVKNVQPIKSLANKKKIGYAAFVYDIYYTKHNFTQLFRLILNKRNEIKIFN